MDSREKLTKSEIVAAFSDLNAQLRAENIRGEICVFGGTAMILALDARESTRDVDAIFAPKELLRNLAHRTAEKFGFKPDWMNDSVKGFISARGATQIVTDLPEFTHLRVICPTPEYLFAMKCMAARIAGYDTGGDATDAKLLLRHLGITDADRALAIVEKYYGDRPIHVKTKFFIEELVQDFAKECDGNP